MAHKDKTKSANDALSTFHDIPVTDFVLTKRTSLHKYSEAPGSQDTTRETYISRKIRKQGKKH